MAGESSPAHKASTCSRSGATPIIWRDRVFISSPDAEKNIHLICINRVDGKVLWDKEAYQGVPKVTRHPKASHANSTPATDGKHVIAFFASEGLYCYDMNGELKWKKDLGVLDSGAPGAS